MKVRCNRAPGPDNGRNIWFRAAYKITRHSELTPSFPPIHVVELNIRNDYGLNCIAQRMKFFV